MKGNMSETKYWGFTEGKELFSKTLREIRYGGYKFLLHGRNNPVKTITRPLHFEPFYNKYCRYVYNKKRVYTRRRTELKGKR